MKYKYQAILIVPALIFLTGCTLVSSGTDGGVFRSDDGGVKFGQKVTIDEKTKFSNADVLSLAVNSQDANVAYVGTKSSGILKTADAGETWQPLEAAETTPGKVYAIAVDPVNPGNVYVAAIIGGRGKIVKSGDAGANWKDIYTEPSDGSFVLALALNPKDPQKIFAGNTKGQIIFSSNGGDTWSNLYEASAEVYKITTDSFNPGIVYFAVYQGGLLRTKDEGRSFENIGRTGAFVGQNQLGNPTAIFTDPNRENLVYVGSNQGLFRSKDAGDNWDLIKVLNRPEENAIRGIGVNPQNSDEIVYGAAQAFYKSVDGGQSWATVQFGGKRIIETIAYNPQNPAMIYIGMNQR